MRGDNKGIGTNHEGSQLPITMSAPLKPLPPLRVVELPLKGRANLFPVAEMCLASYCHYRLDLQRQGPEAVEAARRDLRKWHLQVRILKEFWLSKHYCGGCKPPALQHIAQVLAGDLDDCAVLRRFLSSYLRVRGLPEDAAPRVLIQHRMLFAEYFSVHDWQLGNDRQFDGTLHVLHGAEGDAVVVGQVLIGGWRREQRQATVACGKVPPTRSDSAAEPTAAVPSCTHGTDGDMPSPMMQGIIACPFYTQHLRSVSSGPCQSLDMAS